MEPAMAQAGITCTRVGPQSPPLPVRDHLLSPSARGTQVLVVRRYPLGPWRSHWLAGIPRPAGSARPSEFGSFDPHRRAMV